MPFNFTLRIYPVFRMAMPVNVILVIYVILCILSYDFNKLTMLYIPVHISISMTNKSGLTFFLSIKYLSVCLSDSRLTVTQWFYLNDFIQPIGDKNSNTPMRSLSFHMSLFACTRIH